MIYPSVDELTGDKYNRYILCIATAKCARKISDELNNKNALLTRDVKEEKSYKKQPDEKKPVKMAISRFYNGRYIIKKPQQ